MKALVKVIHSNGNEYSYTIEDIINVLYTMDGIVFIRKDGTSTSYKNAIDCGYKYTISIL